MKVIVGAAITIALAMGLIALASAAPKTEQASYRSANVILEDLRFTPNRIEAKVGVPLNLVLTNRGTERHDLSFPSLHMPGLQGVEAILEPGESRTVTVVFDKPGSHTFICTLPGHATAGMAGAVFVVP
jgi:uncharacterized cupredoxin-like copper-binding protein